MGPRHTRGHFLLDLTTPGSLLPLCAASNHGSRQTGERNSFAPSPLEACSLACHPKASSGDLISTSQTWAAMGFLTDWGHMPILCLRLLFCHRLLGMAGWVWKANLKAADSTSKHSMGTRAVTLQRMDPASGGSRAFECQNIHQEELQQKV